MGQHPNTEAPVIHKQSPHGSSENDTDEKVNIEDGGEGGKTAALALAGSHDSRSLKKPGSSQSRQ